MGDAVTVVRSMVGMVTALFFAKLCLNDIPHIVNRQMLVDEFGSWSVGRAESVCPKGDLSCIKAEAARLQKTVLKESGFYE